MTTPADLAALQELAEALDGLLESGCELDDTRLSYVSMQVDRADIARALLAAREALERISQGITELPHVKDGQGLLALLGLPHASSLELAEARIARLEGALGESARGRHGWHEEQWSDDVPFEACTTQACLKARAALEGRDE